MKIKNLLPLAFAFLFFSACQKEADEALVSTSSQATPEYYLSKLVEDVIFQLDHHDLTTGQHNGWLIDRHGEVKSYSISADRINMGDQCDAADLRSLAAAAGTSLFTIPAEELVENIRKSRQVFSSTLSESIPNENATRLTRLMVFRAIAGNNASTSEYQCANSSHTNTVETEREFQRILLKSEGASMQLNNNQNAPELIDWLEGLDEKLNL